MIINSGKDRRYNDWLIEVGQWCAKHGITKTQAINILFNDAIVGGKESINSKELFWNESSEFAQRYFSQDNTTEEIENEEPDELECYIHYHEYDHNKQHPTLVIRGGGVVSGYNVSEDGDSIGEKTCICAAYYENECCCSYDWRK